MKLKGATLVDEGWKGLRAAYCKIEGDQPDDRMEVLRTMFMAGAYHLWTVLLPILTAGHEPDKDDIYTITLVAAEMTQWNTDMMQDDDEEEDAE